MEPRHPDPRVPDARTALRPGRGGLRRLLHRRPRPAARGRSDEPAPDPADLARQADRLLAELPRRAGRRRAPTFVGAHLRALACAGRKFAGEDVGFVDEVRGLLRRPDRQGRPGALPARRTPSSTTPSAAPARSPTGCRPTARRRRSRPRASRSASTPSPARCATASARRSRCPTRETINYEVVTDKPWSGFNYYLGDYRSTVAVNADLKQQMSNLPRLVAHESYPGHHTEHCRKEAGLVGQAARSSRRIFLVNTPQCLMAEGLADLALVRRGRPGLGQLGHRDLRRPRPALRRRAGRGGLGGDGRAGRCPPGCGADAARRTSRRRRRRRLPAALAAGRATNGPGSMLRFLSSPLWRAYTSTYVEGYRLLRGWLDARPDG